MIETHSRDPQQTLHDVSFLVEVAAREGLRPHAWNMGFFCVRDLIRTQHPNWSRDSKIMPMVSVFGALVRVSELEDRITLDARRPDPVSGAVNTRCFIVDRRAGEK